ncbi:MAG: helix-hairpin-helix domain-containing protein [Candidatus Micrarchaeota archaeon]
MNKRKSEAIERLQTLKNVGRVTAEKLYSIGIKTPEHMKRSDPKKLYEKLKMKCGGTLDRCVLYQFRGAKSNRKWWLCRD